MCAQFDLLMTGPQMERLYGALFPASTLSASADAVLRLSADSRAFSSDVRLSAPEEFEPFTKSKQKVTPHKLAPVFTKDGLKMMKFSLLPSWSKEPKVKFATHNARIETIDEKATWKKPFQTNHCLVPISDFIEPIYTGEFAGYMVKFQAPSAPDTQNSEPNTPIITAAGLYDTWVNKQTGEVIDSFTIITTEPPKFIADIGHDRCPIFLKETAFKEWLSPKTTDPKILKEFLLTHQQEISFIAEKDRPMKPGWEKRI